jgi:hypothetical protein
LTLRPVITTCRCGNIFHKGKRASKNALSNFTDMSKGSWITLVAFLAYTGFIGYLYLVKTGSNLDLSNAFNQERDSLEVELEKYKDLYAAFEQKEFQRAQSVYENQFDPFDSNNYRVYGLFRDIGKRYTAVDVAKMFHINSANAIKSSDVLGERWFIVPVKGVHYFAESETLTDIAKLYYKKPADSVLLIKFNVDAVPGRNLFIPFNK